MGIRLTPMNERDYEEFLLRTIDEYAREKVRAGAWLEEESVALAISEFDRFLPQGLQTPDAFLYVIEEQEQGYQLGHLWIGLIEGVFGKVAFLYEINIFEAHRNRGYGTEAMQKLEVLAAELGAIQIALHVFGHNKRAYLLYDKMGYEVKNVSMAKAIAKPTNSISTT